MQPLRVIVLSICFLIVLVLTALVLGKIFRTFSHTMGKGIEKPPLNVGRVIAEILVGSILGGVIGTLFPGGLTLLWLNFLSGFVGGSAGIYFVGTRGNQTGSFLATWIGGILGILGAVTVSTVVGFASRILLRSALQRSLESVVIIIVFLPVLGATIGFNMTRRYKSPAV
jgi:hypothetical protein